MNDRVKVKITYTTEIGDVPREVARNLQPAFELADEIQRTIDKVIAMMARASGPGIIEEHIQSLELSLAKLDKISDRLIDSTSVLKGYLNLLKNSDNDVILTKEQQEQKEILSDS